ncbi:MAG: hypothetical protein OEM66_04260 [Acidimicrobiia bacterium]|nr:hypothetical protein [Acidimicrobiia bacterium]
MGRLRRFGENRFLGTRDDMRVYDCDEPGQFSALEARDAADDLVGQNLISAIAPDTIEEARNRGFRAIGGAGS